MRRYQQWLSAASMALLMLMIGLEYSAVSLALPEIAAHFSISLRSIVWVLNAYLLAWSVAMIPMGHWIDYFGKKRALYVGLFVFCGASLFAGFSHGVSDLLVWRVAQGIGAAILFPCCTGIGYTSFAPEERGLAVGFIITAASIGMALGPILAGYLIHWLSWRWVFFINIPMGLLVLTGVLLFVRHHIPRAKRLLIDVPGFLTFAMFLSCVLWYLSQGPFVGWFSLPNLVWLGIGLIGFVLFVLTQKYQRNPMLPAELLANHRFVYGTMARAFLNMCLGMLLFVGPLLLQNVLHFSAWKSGWLMLPFTFGFGLFAFVTGHLTRFIVEVRLAKIGLVVLMLGLLGVSFQGMHHSVVYFCWFYALSGAGLGVVAPSLTTQVMRVASPQTAGITAAIYYVVATISCAIGGVVATLALGLRGKHVLTAELARHHIMVTPAHFDSLLNIFSGALSPTSHLSAAVARYVDEAFLSGYACLFWFGMLFCVVAIIILIRMRYASK